jgi:hypothetical protein
MPPNSMAMGSPATITCPSAEGTAAPDNGGAKAEAFTVGPAEGAGIGKDRILKGAKYYIDLAKRQFSRFGLREKEV